MRCSALQSAVGGMAPSVIGMIAAALGILPPVTRAVAQEFIDLAVVLNALRVAIPTAEKTDFLETVYVKPQRGGLARSWRTVRPASAGRNETRPVRAGKPRSSPLVRAGAHRPALRIAGER